MQNPEKILISIRIRIEKLNKIEYLVLVCLILIPILLGSGLFFRDIWLDKAFNIDTRTKTEIHVANGYYVRMLNYSYNVDNYVPFYDLTVYPIVQILNSTGKRVDQIYYPNSSKLSMLESKLKNYGITGIEIDSFIWKTSYGDKELISPLKIKNSSNFQKVQTIGLAKTTLLINWRYNKSRVGEPYTLILQYSSDPNGSQVVPDGSIAYRRTILKGLPYLFFVFSGFMFSFFVFKNGKLMNDYNVLMKFPTAYKEAGFSEMKEMDESLSNIVRFPEKVNRFWRLVFGMSVFVINALVNEKCKIYSEKVNKIKEIAPFRKNSLSKIFSKGKKSIYEKIGDTLPELKTIGIVATALAGVGVTFSFNYAATAPFLYCLALFYFFINLGSIFQFVLISKWDNAWTLSVILLAILTILLPEYINVARLAS